MQDTLVEITGNSIIHTIVQAEPIGPKKLFDILIVAPCTANTLAKLANGIVDTSVTMAVKSHLRNNRPVLIRKTTILYLLVWIIMRKSPSQWFAILHRLSSAPSSLSRAGK